MRKSFGEEEMKWESLIRTVSKVTGKIEVVALAGSPTLAYSNSDPSLLIASTNCPSAKMLNCPAVRYDSRRAMPGASVGEV